MIISLIVANIVITIVLYLFARIGTQHYLDNAPDDSEIKSEVNILRLILIVILMAGLACHGIIGYTLLLL